MKLTMPVLAVGGEKSFGPLQAVISGTSQPMFKRRLSLAPALVMEERPAETVALIRRFLDSQ